MKDLKSNEIERIYLNQLYNSNYFNRFDKKLYTHWEQYSSIDGEIYLFDKGTGKLSNRLLIEIKVRDRYYSEMLLEANKYFAMSKYRTKVDKAMKKECAIDIKSKIMYFCVTPKGSYLFDLDKINMKQQQWQTQWHNRTTNFGPRKKVEKEVTYLNCNLSKEFGDIKTEEQHYTDTVKLDFSKKNQKQNEQMYKCILKNWDL